MIDKKALRKLYQKLPPASSKIILDRVNAKHQLNFTLRYVHAVLNPDDSRYNTFIIEEAILYLEEFNKGQSDLENRIIQA
jgi:hypothetical protein